MADIKIKDIGTKTIKTLDKTVSGLKNTKDNLVDIKDNVDNISTKEESVNQGASDKVITGSNYIKTTTVTSIPKIGNKGIENTKNNLIKLKNKGTKKLTEKTIKSTIKTGNKTIKGTAKTTKVVVNNTRRTAIIMKQLAIKSYVAIKTGIIATAKTIKLAIIGTKALISALVAGGWIALVVIILVCIIGLLCSSIFGIFFAGESSNSSMRVSDVVKSIDNELVNKTELIKTQNVHDEVILKVDRASWSEVLALYSAKTTGGTGMNEVITMNESKAQTLKNIFFQMHTITHEVKTENISLGGTGDYEIGGSTGSAKKVLYITITSKSVEEMMNMQYFTLSQRNEVNELLKDEYAALWSSTIYGTSIGSSDMVTVALSQLGNVGGQPYWSWYGFESRVEWCATFVSWVANEVGYIDSGVVPKFAGVNQGVSWFQLRSRYKDSNYIPKSGDIIFYDWDGDNDPDHVGIVEKVENSKIYTVEGNMSDKVQNLNYDINSDDVFGFGLIQ